MALPPALPFSQSGTLILIVSIVSAVLPTFTTAGRFYARKRTHSPIAADDWVILAALIAMYSHVALVIISERYGGAGHHASTIHESNIILFLKLLTGAQFTFGVSLGLAKVSICLLLIRIFSVKQSFKIAAYLVLTYNVAWIFMPMGIGAGLCRPIEYNWNKNIPGKCGHRTAAYISVAATDILGDIMIIILPMRRVCNLQTPTAKKIGLSIVFGLAVVDIIVAILRIHYILQTTLAPGFDFTYDSVNIYIWSVIEPALANIIASLTLQRLAFVGCFQGVRRRTSSGQSRSIRGDDSRQTQSSDGAMRGYPLLTFEKMSGLGSMNADIAQGHRAEAAGNAESASDQSLELEDIYVRTEFEVRSDPADRYAA